MANSPWWRRAGVYSSYNLSWTVVFYENNNMVFSTFKLIDVSLDFETAIAELKASYAKVKTEALDEGFDVKIEDKSQDLSESNEKLLLFLDGAPDNGFAISDFSTSAVAFEFVTRSPNHVADIFNAKQFIQTRELLSDFTSEEEIINDNLGLIRELEIAKNANQLYQKSMVNFRRKQTSELSAHECKLQAQYDSVLNRPILRLLKISIEDLDKEGYNAYVSDVKEFAGTEKPTFKARDPRKSVLNQIKKVHVSRRRTQIFKELLL